MGYNTAFYLLNDAIPSIQRDPERFTEMITAAASSGGFSLPPGFNRHGQFGVGGHANVAGIIKVAHADSTIVCAVGGNLGTCLGVVGGYHHAKPEEQTALLKKLMAQRKRLRDG